MTESLNHALSAYRAAAAQVHPLVAVVKLYDEALRRIERTIEATDARRVEEAYINLTKACLVLRGLTSNLRFDLGGDVAETLKTTYVTNMIALHTAFGKPDAPARYRRVMEGLLALRNAWAEIAGMPQKQALPRNARTPLQIGDKVG
jgi:flagellar protein FliS